MTLPRNLQLTEHVPALGVQLSRDQVLGLRSVAPSVAITLSPSGLDLYDLRPGAIVGGIQVGALSIQIRPKLNMRRVLFLVSYVLDRAQWQKTPFEFDEEKTLLEALVPGFAFHFWRAVNQGLLFAYRVEEQEQNTVRGRIRFEDQTRRHFGLLLPVAVRYDDFTVDNTENRLLRAAVNCLGRMPIRSANIRRKLRAIEAALNSVSLLEYSPKNLPEITYTRLNEHYRPALELAKLVLKSSSFELSHGTVRSQSFLVDMNQVFEDFVILALRDVLRLTPGEFPQNCRGHGLWLDEARTIKLEPDLSWWGGGVCRFVGDVKYKAIDVSGVHNDDIYQLLAYTIASSLPQGLLIYPASEHSGEGHSIVNIGKLMQVRTIDLDRSPESILEQIGVLAAHIAALTRQNIAA
ncbi:MAG: hypothetical protein EXR47_08915 [Dehalococcoidia bacterium]|nr:hypothetical protein [Dehalococcoidia bacterium]